METARWGETRRLIAVVICLVGLIAARGDAVAVATAQTASSMRIDEETTRWQVTDGDYSLTAPAVAGDLVATARDAIDDAPTLVVLDRRTGDTVWSWQAPADTWISTSPVIDGQALYLATAPNEQYGGTLYALDLRTGDLQWTASTEQSIAVEPAVAAGVIYVQAGELLALDAATG